MANFTKFSNCLDLLLDSLIEIKNNQKIRKYDKNEIKVSYKRLIET